MSTDALDQFENDMYEAGFRPYHYHGRAMWHGPAVNADDVQDVIRATSVRVTWDSMGHGVVVYPVQSMGGDVFGCTITDEPEDD
jgi:hypothetical protein